MYQVGERVLYGIHGLCAVVGIEDRVVDRKNVSYYVLEPQDQTGSKFYVPMHNPAAVGKMRRMIAKEALLELLSSDEVRCDAWIQDENQRKQRYRELIGSGDRTSLLRMVHSLHIHRKEQLGTGRKVHICDENFLRDAEKLLSSEFSVVLDIPHEKIGEYMQSLFQE